MCESAKQRAVNLSSAVQPNLFDVIHDTDLIASLCIASLMSAALWEVRDKLRQSLESTDLDGEDEAGCMPMSVRRIQAHINKSFTHLHPSEIAEVYGMLNLEKERERFSKDVFNAMVAGLKVYFEERGRSDPIMESVRDQVMRWFEQEQFPNFTYSNYDLIRAHRNLQGKGKKRSKALSSCLDEAALFIALCLIVPHPGEVIAMMVMSSFSHYGVFGYAADGGAWWFNGKNQLFSKREWDNKVEESGGDYQGCFDQVFANFDRITTVSGCAHLISGVHNIPEPYLAEYLEKMEAFFGVRLQQLERLQPHEGGKVSQERGHADFLRGLIGLESREDLLRRLSEGAEDWVLKAHYCYRSLEVDDFTPYLLAARRNPSAATIGASAESIEALLQIVREIPVSRTIFGEMNRISMPDEILRLNAGGHRDKGLLLHVMIEHYAFSKDPGIRVETLFLSDDTWVKMSGHWVTMGAFETHDVPPSQPILHRI